MLILRVNNMSSAPSMSSHFYSNRSPLRNMSLTTPDTSPSKTTTAATTAMMTTPPMNVPKRFKGFDIITSSSSPPRSWAPKKKFIHSGEIINGRYKIRKARKNSNDAIILANYIRDHMNVTEKEFTSSSSNDGDIYYSASHSEETIEEAFSKAARRLVYPTEKEENEKTTQQQDEEPF